MIMCLSNVCVYVSNVCTILNIMKYKYSNVCPVCVMCVSVYSACLLMSINNTIQYNV